MGKLIFQINLSLDGYADHTVFQATADDEMHEFYAGLLDETELVLFGRLTYQLMEGYWPHAHEDSRMDLISCRNLLIYLNRDAQDRVLDTFHFALNPEGRLFLGTSESVEDSRLFLVLDKKNRIYTRRPGTRAGLPVPLGPRALLRVLESQSRTRVELFSHGKRFVQDSVAAVHGTFKRNTDRGTLAELHFRLIERFGPPSVIVNPDHDVVHISEHAGEFLKFSGGEPTLNLLQIVHPMLRVELRTALFRATDLNEPVESLGVPVQIDGQPCVVDLRVAPAYEIAPGYLLVVFEKRMATAVQATEGDQASTPAQEPLVRHLEHELEQVKGRLRDNVEQSEASTEELKASNEELQAMNEELRSATEELETSREELQSINEELITVNQEMKVKMDEIAHANSDLQNLMASTAIAIIFLDRDMTITRYTPSAVDLFHLIPGDLGRPLAHLKHRLEYPELMTDAEQVLRTLVPIEREVRANGEWYLARLQPYRTLEDHIARRSANLCRHYRTQTVHRSPARAAYRAGTFQCRSRGAGNTDDRIEKRGQRALRRAGRTAAV